MTINTPGDAKTINIKVAIKLRINAIRPKSPPCAINGALMNQLDAPTILMVLISSFEFSIISFMVLKTTMSATKNRMAPTMMPNWLMERVMENTFSMVSFFSEKSTFSIKPLNWSRCRMLAMVSYSAGC